MRAGMANHWIGYPAPQSAAAVNAALPTLSKVSYCISSASMLTANSPAILDNGYACTDINWLCKVECLVLLSSNILHKTWWRCIPDHQRRVDRTYYNMDYSLCAPSNPSMRSPSHCHLARCQDMRCHLSIPHWLGNFKLRS